MVAVIVGGYSVSESGPSGTCGVASGAREELSQRVLEDGCAAAEGQGAPRRGRYGSDMDIELLYFDDCPNWTAAAAVLDELATERGDLTILHRRVRSDEDARRLSFYGSPSIHVGGVDLFEPAADVVPSVSCRMYRTSNGYSGTPSLGDLRAAIDARVTS